MPAIDFLSSIVKGIGAAGRIVGPTGKRLFAPTVEAMASQRNAMFLNFGLGVGLPLLTQHGGRHKLKGALEGGFLALATGGMGPGRQMLAMTMIGSAPAIIGMSRGFGNAYRSGQSQRTAAAIPFSHTSAPMDHAFATMQYAQNRMQGAYSGIGNTAAFYAARYTTR